jgi:hypothetical protein
MIVTLLLRRDQRRPVMGSFAAASNAGRRLCRAFFRGDAATAGATGAAADHILIQELLTAAGAYKKPENAAVEASVTCQSVPSLGL